MDMHVTLCDRKDCEWNHPYETSNRCYKTFTKIKGLKCASFRKRPRIR